MVLAKLCLGREIAKQCFSAPFFMGVNNKSPLVITHRTPPPVRSLDATQWNRGIHRTTPIKPASAQFNHTTQRSTITCISAPVASMQRSGIEDFAAQPQSNQHQRNSTTPTT